MAIERRSPFPMTFHFLLWGVEVCGNSGEGAGSACLPEPSCSGERGHERREPSAPLGECLRHQRRERGQLACGGNPKLRRHRYRRRGQWKPVRVKKTRQMKNPHPQTYHAGRGREGEAIPASRTARMPVRKMPSKVPAPPIEATGAPRPLILSRLRRSAPTSVPIEPPI
jgi:hypothetical protein